MPNVSGFRLVQNKDGSFEIVSRRCERKQKAAPAGSSRREIYQRKYDEGHNAHYAFVKEVNMYERIQSALKSTDIVTLMARYAKGDETALNQRQGFYGDFSGFSDTRDAYAAYASMKGVYDSLAQEQKNQFGGSFENFLRDLAVRASTPAAPAQGVEPNKEVTPSES